jgi:hypothetical protein
VELADPTTQRLLVGLRVQVKIGNRRCLVKKRSNVLAVEDPVVVVVLSRMIEASNNGEETEDQILVAVHVVTTLGVVRILIAGMAVDLRVDIHKDLSIVLLVTSTIVPRDP